MPLSDEERRKRTLQRYFDNKEKYNERQKKYFREVWYPKNKHKFIKERKEKKEIKEKIIKEKNILKQKMIINNNKNLIIDFN